MEHPMRIVLLISTIVLFSKHVTYYMEFKMKRLLLLIVAVLFASQAFCYEYVVFKYGNETALKNRLNALALSYREGVDEDGNPYRTEEFLGLVSTPHLEDINGDKYFATRLAEDDAAKMPPSNNPAFALIWRDTEQCDTGEVDEELNPIMGLCPWPEVTVEYPELDVDGNPTGVMLQRTQAVGRIQ
jgi:hypothetical protein